MNTKREALIERMKKVLALAKQGEGGERDNAERQLESMLKKYGFTMADIEDTDGELIKVEFHYKTYFEARLIQQIVANVLGRNELDFRARKGTRAFMSHVMTRAQKIECELYVAIMTPAMNEQLLLAFGAFIQVHKLYAPAKHDEDYEKDDTPEERMRRKKIAGMAAYMDKTHVRKAIESKPA